MRSDFVTDNATVTRLMMFYAEQDKWTRTMIKNHPSEEDAFWRHVEYVMSQFDGLYAGYRAAALKEWVMASALLFLFLNVFLHVGTMPLETGPSLPRTS